MTDLAVRPRQTGELRGKDLGGEYMFYDEDTDRHHVLNVTAREVFLLCDGTRTAEEVVREMIKQYEVDEATLRHDVPEAIEKLLELNLLTL
jgi:hypothetical protein